MRNPFKVVDNFIYTSIQEGYLWLLDRTGIYVASISISIFLPFAYLIIYETFHKKEYGWTIILIPIVVLNLLLLYQKYHMQANGLTTAYNLRAIATRPSMHWQNIFVLFFLIFNLGFFDPKGIMLDISLILYNYLLIILIRDRDKKPFFKTEPKLAQQTT